MKSSYAIRQKHLYLARKINFLTKLLYMQENTTQIIPQQEQQEQNTRIFIDYREHIIIDSFHTQNIPFTTQNLPIGDFIIQNNTNKLIIERKTFSDLVSSIIDGRFRDQKSRLSQLSLHENNVSILFIFEKNQFPPKFSKNKDGAILNLLFNSTFKVLFSNSPTHTTNLLYNIYHKFSSFIFPQNLQPVQQINLKNYKKHSNTSPFFKLLISIDGISTVTANKICSVYPNFNSFYNDFITQNCKLKINKTVQQNLSKLFC